MGIDKTKEHTTVFFQSSKMTRTAKRGPENKKRHDATEWSALKIEPNNGGPVRQNHNSSKGHRGQNKWAQGSKWSNKGNNHFKKRRTGEEELLHMVLHKEQRRERRREKTERDRQMKKLCFKCRLPGHRVEDCIMSNSGEGTGICYKCGSTEHTVAGCKANLPAGKMPY